MRACLLWAHTKCTGPPGAFWCSACNVASAPQVCRPIACGTTDAWNTTAYVIQNARHANTSHTIMYGALAFGGASFLGRSSHLTCDCATGLSAFRPGYKRAEALAQNKQAVARLQVTSQSSTRSTRSSPSSLCEPRSQHRWLDAVQHLVYVHLVRCSVHTLGHSHTKIQQCHLCAPLELDNMLACAIASNCLRAHIKFA